MRRLRFAIEVALVAVLLWVLGSAAFRAGSVPPSTEAEELAQVVSVLRGLEHDIERGDALHQMQRMFPEGACFTLTLYGVSWANVAEHPAVDGALRTAIARLSYAVAHVSHGVCDRSVHRHPGEARRVLAWSTEFAISSIAASDAGAGATGTSGHRVPRELAAAGRAFLASPTGISIRTREWSGRRTTSPHCSRSVLHDHLYGTDHARAYQEWKQWTLDHLDPATGLMGGRLNSSTGALIEPARGGNSWITTLLAEIDPEFAKDLYSRYRKHFAIKRLDFLMFREWPRAWRAGNDIDSGPIIWDAGMTATGVGLAAARANGDAEMASDIHALSELLAGRP